MKALFLKYFMFPVLLVLGGIAFASDYEREECCSDVTCSAGPSSEEDEDVSEAKDFKIRCFSSEISAKPLGYTIFDYVKEAESRVVFASDQCTNEEFLDDVSKLPRVQNKEVDVFIVTSGGKTFSHKRTFNVLQKFPLLTVTYVEGNSNGSGKMHNKFILIDDKIVITGSPNLTYAAYNFNVESLVVLENADIANLYEEYYKYLVNDGDKYDHQTDSFKAVETKMEAFNALGFPVKVCLAPIRNIKDFILEDLLAADIVKINMFLISRGTNHDNDVIKRLIELAEQDTQMQIKVDDGMYGKNRYVQEALKNFESFKKISSLKVIKKPFYTKTRTKEITANPSFHDKLILISQGNDLNKIFIGSAGLTTNVQDNSNLENMLCIENEKIFDFFSQHFGEIRQGNTEFIVEEI